MKKRMKRLICLMLSLVIVGAVLPATLAAEKGQNATVLFTHDLHSHLLPAEKEEGGEYGGYARLMTEIRAMREKYPAAPRCSGVALQCFSST